MPQLSSHHCHMRDTQFCKLQGLQDHMLLVCHLVTIMVQQIVHLAAYAWLPSIQLVCRLHPQVQGCCYP